MNAVLTGNDVLRLDNARDLQVRVESGTLWITQERDTRDVMLGAGQSFRFDRKGAALLSACGQVAHIRVSTAPVERRAGFGAMLTALLVAGCASTVPVPESLKPAAGESLARIVPAKGVQIYECRDRKWVFVAPEADLYDTRGNLIGRHYAGPHWELADGSKVVASVKSRADAPVAGAIPWLLLGAKSVGGKGSLSQVTSIQRVATVGGVAPAGDCEQGQRARVDYTADYYFFNARQQ